VNEICTNGDTGNELGDNQCLHHDVNDTTLYVKRMGMARHLIGEGRRWIIKYGQNKQYFNVASEADTSR